MTTGPASPDDPEQLLAAIEQTREELGRTVEQLVAKTDVKARAQAKVSDLAQRAKDATSQVRHQAAAQAGSARSQLADRYQAAGPLKQAATQRIQRARTHRKPLIIAAGALIAGAVVVVTIWRRR
jgi:small-conductance mechanosensitive channel